MSTARNSVELLQWIHERRAHAEATSPVPLPPVAIHDAVHRTTAQAKVQKSTTPDAERISKLPRWSEEQFAGIDLTDKYKLPSGTMRLRPLQSMALHWIERQRGLVGMLGTGAGKTIVSLLAPLALNAQRPVLLIPPTMQIPLQNEMQKLKQHWKMPKNLFVIPYSELSVAKSTDLLERLRPDLIISDECHCVANADAARSKRLMRYFRSCPETRFIALSGTLTGKSLKDYGHLSELALRLGSPLPLDEATLMAWAACVDSESRINARNIPKDSDWSTFAAFKDMRHIEDLSERRDEARKVFHKRLRATPGVVASKEGSTGCSLMLLNREVTVPEVVKEALTELRKTWTRPDAEELVSALDLHRCAMEMAQGYFLRWDWPNGVVDHEWLAARGFWHREVRYVLNQNRVGLDSPLLVTRAVMRATTGIEALARVGGATIDGINKTLISAWEGWDKVRGRPKPPTVVVWLDTFLVEDALRWRKNHRDGLLWYSSKAMAEALRVCGERVILAGENPPLDGKGMCLSVSSHGQGLNLQKWNENLVLSWPSSGRVCEQLVARTCRFGQLEDEVNCWFYSHTVDAKVAVKRSREDAAYIEQTTGSSQLLNRGVWV